MLNDQQIEDKYKIVFVEHRRYYYLSLADKEYSLECTTPLSLDIGIRQFISTSWKQLLLDVCTYLVQVNPGSENMLLDYNPTWSDKKPFSTVQSNSWYPVGDGIYLICNHTALHACWLLREILELYGIELNKCKFIIHRPPGAEPKECRDFYGAKTKKAFIYYYVELLKRPQEKADQIIRNIDRLNKLLAVVSRSYDNFFLIDDNTTYANYKAVFLDFLRYKKRLEEKQVLIADKYLTILGDFYKAIR